MVGLVSFMRNPGRARRAYSGWGGKCRAGTGAYERLLLVGRGCILAHNEAPLFLSEHLLDYRCRSSLDATSRLMDLGTTTSRAAGGGICNGEKPMATSARKFVFNANLARRMPDPAFHKSLGIERHILMVPIRGIPEDLPYDPNARLPSTRRRVYREIEESLLDGGDNTPGTFHLKHKGITLIADAVHHRGESAEYTVICKPGQGIVDGGHTYDLIAKNRDNPDLPHDQYVKFEIITNIPEDWITEIAGGLNTSVQVEEMSLHNLASKFDWIKDELEDQSYFDRLAWREGDDGVYDARDIIALMTCFLIDRRGGGCVQEDPANPA
jgi:hypothetical protein